MGFLIIGLFWILHHEFFWYIRRYKVVFIWLNLVFLMYVVFTPFTTNVNSTYHSSRAASVLYAVSAKRLVDEDLEPTEGRRAIAASLATSLIFLCSIGIAYVSLPAARYSLLLLIPVNLCDVLHHRKRYEIREY